MRFKYKAKLFKVVMFISGVLTLVACNYFGKVDEPSTSSDPSNPDEPSTPDTPDNPNDPDKEDKVARINAQIKIESLLKDKINERFDENVVSTVEAHTFTLKDSVESGKTLETSGYVILADDDEAKPVTLGLPVSLEQYTNLYELDFNTYDSTKQLSENYTLEQLNFADTIISNANLTYNYAILNGSAWDLDAARPTKIEKKLEAYFEQKMQSYFQETMNRKYIENVDFKYFTTEHTSSYGDVIKINGFSKSIKTGKLLPTIVMLKTSQSNYLNASAIVNNITFDESKNMAENYNLDIMNFLDNVVKDENTTIKHYDIDGAGYYIEDTFNL